MKFLKIRTPIAAAALIAISAICNQASASLVTYTQDMGGFSYNSDTVSGTFQTALGSGYSHISFSGSTNNAGNSYSPDVTFSTKAGVFGGSNTSLVNAADEVGPYGSWDGILNINFGSSYVSAVGFGLVQFDSAVEKIRIYDAANTLLGTFNNQLGSEFSLWGVKATAGEQISRIELDGNFFAIQDIEFGGKGRNVPDNGSTLISLALGLFCICSVWKRKA